MSSVQTLSLGALAPGETAIIESIALPPDRQLYFLELGFVAGEQVRYIRPSPWGDPLVVEILGIQLAIRLSDAQAIHVRRLESRS